MARMDDDAVAESLARIKRDRAAYARAEKAIERARERLHASIVRAFEVGARPVEVEAVSPYDRNHNARLRDAAGVPGVRTRKSKD